MSDQQNPSVDQGDPEPLYKVILVGDSAVGKSSLTNRWVSDEFELDNRETIGFDLKLKTVVAKKSTTETTHPVRLHIWDTSGQERFRTITTNYYRGAHGIMLIFDLTDRQSFSDLFDCWLKLIQQHATLKSQVLLVGNKADLVQEYPTLRTVHQREAEDMVQRHSLWGYCETSALSGAGVDEAFVALANGIVDLHPHLLVGDGNYHPTARRPPQAASTIRLTSSSSVERPFWAYSPEEQSSFFSGSSSGCCN